MPRESKVDAHLLVEGENDLHVISALCQKHNVPETFDILHPKRSSLQADGVDQLLENFRLQLLGSAGDTKALGVVLDADDLPDQRWQQVTSVIKRVNFGYVISAHPEPNGVIISAPYDYRPRVGIWLMPNNVTFGELADFVSFLIPSNDKLSPYANNTLDEIERINLNLYKKKRSKAFIHTWLAWQSEPGLPMGRAITAKALSADSSIALTFVDWLNRLFNS
jgi:hypothetical protein